MKGKEVIQIEIEEEKFDSKRPHRLIQKGKQETIYEPPYIISKYIKIPNNPNYSPLNNINNIKKLNYQYNPTANKNNILPQKSSINRINPTQQVNDINKNINSNLNTDITNIYNRKRLSRISNNATFSTIGSRKNSYFSIGNNNLNKIENIPFDFNAEMQAKSKDDIKVGKSKIKSPNILVKKIYETDDIFTKNLGKGVLCLKDIEVIKTNKISLLDLDNEDLMKNQNGNNNQSLGHFLAKSQDKTKNNGKDLKHYEIIGSYDSLKNRKNNLSKSPVNGNIKERELSEQPKKGKKKAVYKRGKISMILYYFTKKGSLTDILMVRGSRSEKGGVVDFTIASPRKNNNMNNYEINNDFISKSAYKYPGWKLVSSAKKIQNWWRKKISMYNNYINKIKLIQNFFRNYKMNKVKGMIKKKELNDGEKNDITIKNDLNSKESDILKNKARMLSITLLKKILELKINNKFKDLLLKMRDLIRNNQKKELLKYKYSYFIQTVKDNFNKTKNKNILSFMNKFKKLTDLNDSFGNNKNNNIKNNNTNYNINKNLEIINLPNLFIKGNKNIKDLKNENSSSQYKDEDDLNNSKNKKYDNKYNQNSSGIDKSNYNYNKINEDMQYQIFKNDNFNIISNKQKNKRYSKYTKKIVFKEKDKTIYSKIKNNPDEIKKIILEKIYIKKWFYKVVKIKKESEKKTRIGNRNKIIGSIFSLLLKKIMIDILDKIRKEANRRTLIKAFRNINKLKYPILFYSLLKIKKYSNVKYNVMNAYAKLIQRNFRYYMDKKSKINIYSYSDE